MKLTLLAGLMAGLFVASLASVLHAETPQYLILRAPTRPAPHHPTHHRYPGTQQEVSTHSYSYGWFGVTPRQHWSRHFGYYRNYTQWSGR